MLRCMFFRFFLVLVASIYLSISWASSEVREQEYAEEIETSYSGGEIIWLQAKGRKFLTLYTETEKVSSLGTAIILHPMDGHPDQKEIINPLRLFLPEHNWATLSIQLPVLGVSAKQLEYYPLFDDANARILAAIDHLKKGKVENIVLIGYGLGGMMASYFLNEQGVVKDLEKADVKAIVSISLAVPDSERKQAQVLDFIKLIKQPFLDIFAENDLPEVTDSARKRRLAAKEKKAYRQFQVAGEGHLYQHDEGLVVKRIYSWMSRGRKPE